MEVLVALAITSLLMTLLMGANYYILRVQETLAREVREGESSMRAQAWYRQLIGGLAPLGESSTDAFEGDQKGFRALTLRPLRADMMVAPEAMSLSLERDADGRLSLLYRADRIEMQMASWENATGRFVYRTQAGEQLASWSELKQTSERVPTAIELVISREDDEVPTAQWFARVESAPWTSTLTAAPILPPGGAGESQAWAPPSATRVRKSPEPFRPPLGK